MNLKSIFMREQIITERDDVVVHCVPGTEQERDGRLPRLDENLATGFGVFIQLGEIAAFEFGPLLGIVREPLPQCRARRDFAHPGIQLQILFSDAPRPKTFDENPVAVAARRGIVNPFKLKFASHDSVELSASSIGATALLPGILRNATGDRAA